MSLRLRPMHSSLFAAFAVAATAACAEDAASRRACDTFVATSSSSGGHSDSDLQTVRIVVEPRGERFANAGLGLAQRAAIGGASGNALYVHEPRVALGVALVAPRRSSSFSSSQPTLPEARAK